jgi:hypothetical protein
MKTKIEYEASDIRADNPLHALLNIALVLAVLTITSRDRDKEDAVVACNRAVAGFLTLIEQSGYVITKREEVPAVFRADENGNAP